MSNSTFNYEVRRLSSMCSELNKCVRSLENETFTVNGLKYQYEHINNYIAELNVGICSLTQDKHDNKHADVVDKPQNNSDILYYKFSYKSGYMYELKVSCYDGRIYKIKGEEVVRFLHDALSKITKSEITIIPGNKGFVIHRPVIHMDNEPDESYLQKGLLMVTYDREAYKQYKSIGIDSHYYDSIVDIRVKDPSEYLNNRLTYYLEQCNKQILSDKYNDLIKRRKSTVYNLANTYNENKGYYKFLPDTYEIVDEHLDYSVINFGYKDKPDSKSQLFIENDLSYIFSYGSITKFGSSVDLEKLIDHLKEVYDGTERFDIKYDINRVFKIEACKYRGSDYIIKSDEIIRFLRESLGELISDNVISILYIDNGFIVHRKVFHYLDEPRENYPSNGRLVFTSDKSSHDKFVSENVESYLICDELTSNPVVYCEDIIHDCLELCNTPVLSDLYKKSMDERDLLVSDFCSDYERLTLTEPALPKITSIFTDIDHAKVTFHCNHKPNKEWTLRVSNDNTFKVCFGGFSEAGDCDSGFKTKVFRFLNNMCF